MITVVQNDKNYNLDFTLQDNTGAPLNLTGATLLFKAQHHDDSVLAFSGAMTIVSPLDGTCRYTVANGNFEHKGEYYAEIEVIFGGGSQVVTYTDILITVLPELPR